MGQIVGGAAKPKRCNLNKLSQLDTPAAGEYILVSSDNSMNEAGQGNFDCYIVGDGTKAATELELKKTYANDVAIQELQGDVEKIVQLLPIKDIVVGKNDVSGYNSGDTGYNKYISNSGGIGAYSGYSILGPISLNKGDVLSSVVNGSGMTFLAKVNQDESMTPIILAPRQNTTQTIKYVADDNIVVMLSSNRFQFNGYTIEKMAEVASKDELDKLMAEIASPSTYQTKDYCAYLDRKLIIEENRSYYFDDTYSNETSYIDTSYLDRKIMEVPDGKHFIFLTDSHIDYYNGIWFSQKETSIVKYVRDRLGVRNVIFGGDVIGVRDTKYKAAKVLSIYAKEKYEAFGSDFLFVMGNHDTNPFPNQGGQTIPLDDVLISDIEVYKRVTKPLRNYGKAVFPEKLLNIIDTSNDLVDANNNSMTASEKAEFKAWAQRNYYYDDYAQKIRYIVLETGDGGYTMRNIFGATGDAQISLMTIAYFVIEALKTIPSNFDVVVAGHWIVTAGVHFWRRVFYKLLAAYKNKQIVTLNLKVDTNYYPAPQIIISKEFGNPASLLSIPVDFTNNSGTGRVFCISGHEHYDRATIKNYIDDYTTPSVLAFPITTNTTPQSLEYSDESILHIECDRCCVVEGYFDSGRDGVFSYPNDTAQTPVEQGGVIRIGTTKEVLFDVVTLTDDNRVVLTRFGAEGEDNGSPYVRDYILPIAQS